MWQRENSTHRIGRPVTLESMGGGIYITSHHIFKLKIIALLLAL